MIFTPTSLSFKASNIICVCSSCQSESGSCHSFEEYPLQVHEQTSQATLRTADLQEDERINNDADKTNLHDFIFPGSAIAIPGAEMSNNTVWFI